MEKQEQVEEGIDLVALLKLLLGKIKYLILAVLIGAVLGGSFAIWRTIDVKHYGTRVAFYVNPEKKADVTDEDLGVYGAYGRVVMDGIIKLLSSESFAEKMILNGSDLPEKDVWTNPDNKEETDDLNAKIQTAQDSLNKFNAKKGELIEKKDKQKKTEKDLEKKKKSLDELWASLYYSGLVTNSTFDEKEYIESISAIKEGDDHYAKVASTQLAYGEWSTTNDSLQTLEDEIETLTEDVIPPLLETKDDDLEVALETWRQTAKYKTELTKYSSALGFSFSQSSASSSEGTNFIYVEIFVLNDKDFAEKVLKRVKTLVPEYVEQRMAVPEGYTGTKCDRITRTDDIRRTNPGYTRNQAVKYAVLAAAFAFAITCVAIFLADKADKRLRDVSDITKQFNVPVLGMIPSMEETEEGSLDKKSNEKEAK